MASSRLYCWTMSLIGLCLALIGNYVIGPLVLAWREVFPGPDPLERVRQWDSGAAVYQGQRSRVLMFRSRILQRSVHRPGAALFAGPSPGAFAAA